MDSLLWDKHEGDGRILTPMQSMASGFSAACLGPVATGEREGVAASVGAIRGGAAFSFPWGVALSGSGCGGGWCAALHLRARWCGP
jgi:hypothetical protein